MNGNTVTVKVGKEPEVGTAMNAVSGAIDELAARVDNLCSKISPVRRQEPTADCAKENVTASSVPLAQELYAMRSRIDKIRAVVNTAFDQLEI